LGKSIVFWEVESPRTPEGGLSTKVSVYQLWGSIQNVFCVGVCKMFYIWAFATHTQLLLAFLHNIL